MRKIRKTGESVDEKSDLLTDDILDDIAGVGSDEGLARLGGASGHRVLCDRIACAVV